jgi:hypothetical protein
MYGIHGTLAAASGMAAVIIGTSNFIGYTVLGAAVFFAVGSLRPLLPRRSKKAGNAAATPR